VRFFGKVRRIWKSAPHLQQCCTFEKTRHFWTKWITLGKVRHFFISAAKRLPYLEKCNKLGKNVPHLEKCVTLGKVRHTWKSAAHLEKMYSLGKMRPLGKARHI